VLAITSGVPTDAKVLAADGTLIATLDVATELALDKDKIYQGGYVGILSLKVRI